MKQFFNNEVGGHRFQRIPPTERKGRVHTSTITVAVMDPLIDTFKMDRSEVNRAYTRGSGPGGQNKNKVNSCVVLTHRPTGISVRIDGRDQPKNELEAWTIMEQRLRDLHDGKINAEVSSIRSSQIGGGERGNKRRTYRVKDGIVNDHVTGKQAQMKLIERGKIELLH